MKASSRIPEIDFLRVLALVLMIIYHFIYDLDSYTPVTIHVNTWFWALVGKLAALLFIFISGVSVAISRHPFRNSVKLFFWAFVISSVTYIGMRETYVRFGILHFLGTMMFLYPIFKKRSNGFLILFSVLAIFLGVFFTHTVSSVPWLLPLGLAYPGFTTIDYYPLFPYSGVYVLGILFYRLNYSRLRSSTSNLFIPASSLLEKMSRNSLLIYLIHQPILLFSILLVQKLAT